MVKSLEQYLSDMSFAPPENVEGIKSLSAGERAFVEKYLGLDALEALPRIDPEPLPETPAPIPGPKLRLAEPEIKVLPEIVVVSPAATAKAEASAETKLEQPQIVIAPASEETAQRDEQLVVTKPEAASVQRTDAVREAEPVKVETLGQSSVTSSVPPPTVVESGTAVAQVPVELSLKESMRQQPEVQAVSFFVADQLFLLPVEGIQEVLRHMELIRVPQAPSFVAGVINLRGKVTPLVHLSAVLTNITEYAYDPEKNFIIICGTEPLQVGLIIDRINSMHLLPQDKIIWNPESKLGDAADFLYAIVNLDEKVCGMVAPELITKRILNPDS